MCTCRFSFLATRCVLAALLLFTGVAWTADMPTDEQILSLAKNRSKPAELREAIETRFQPAQLESGEAHFSHGPDFLFVIRSADTPVIHIDDRPEKLKRLKDSDLWMLRTNLKTGTSHAVEYQVDGKTIGRRVDVRAYTPDHYPQPGVPEGELSEEQTHTSEIYPGMVSDWWYYVSPGCTAGEPCAVMVWQDGQNFASRTAPSRLLTVTENLIHQKKIPPMVHVMVAPGMMGDKRMRSIEYDTVDERYARFILEEIFPLVEQRQKLREDGYSRGIAGQSSGGICALTAAWFKPEEFARVLSRIGSYTSIQWLRKSEGAEADLDGGNIFPFLVRKSPKQNIRVWMEDGFNDLENTHGSWPLQNVQLANSLKMKEYDFQFVWGGAQHNTAHGDSLLPEAMAWLWRGYDPAKTSDEFQMDSSEKDKPYFRIRALNRTR